MDNNRNFIPPNHSFNRIDHGSQQSNKPGSSLKSILSTVGIILAAPLIALFLVTSVFQVYEVDGQSMEPTLQDNDRLIVLKTPKTWASITNSTYIPERYDIVVFDKVESYNGVTQERQLIKRVVGLPGDRVTVSNGEVKIYNSDHPDGYLVDQFGPERNFTNPTSGNVDITVSSDEIFLLGDNRSNSSDSRIFGTVPAEQVVGKLALRFYPFDQATAKF